MLKYYVTKILESSEINADLSIKLKHIISLLYTTVGQSKGITRDWLMKLYKIHPEVKKLLELMYEFKGILLRTRKEYALESWLSKAEKCCYDEINSFVKGVRNDFQAVVNCLKYRISNGILEASVNNSNFAG